MRFPQAVWHAAGSSNPKAQMGLETFRDEQLLEHIQTDAGQSLRKLLSALVARSPQAAGWCPGRHL
jgi:hypothetical protein